MNFDFSTVLSVTFRYFSTTPVTCRALQQRSSRIDPNVAFAPTDIGIGCYFPDISSHVKVTQPRAGTLERGLEVKTRSPDNLQIRDARQKDPASPGTFWRVTLFIIVAFSCTFPLFATFRLFARSSESK